MARDRDGSPGPSDAVISIIGPGMTIIGDCQTDGTVRVEGSVEGSIRAGKAVVVGKDGRVSGDIITQDAVISGHVDGRLVAASRLELQATCTIEGEVQTRRMQLEEGAVLNGKVLMGADAVSGPGKKGALPATDKVPEPAHAS
ncbi:MAG: polymer-forming cytoskeletal protein [Gemmatimonadota bacterium]|nr:polymer-forming cytoskeletal protein [Gemmatimonadota bacterium]